MQTSDAGRTRAAARPARSPPSRCELDATGTFTEVRGLDLSHRLLPRAAGRRVPEHDASPTSCRKVAQRAGLKAGEIDPATGIGGEPQAQLSQDNVSDWVFLHRLADTVGAQVLVRRRRARLPAARSARRRPRPAARATQDPLVLEVNRNLICAARRCHRRRAGAGGRGRAGWDSGDKQAVERHRHAEDAGAEVAGVDPAELGQKFGGPPYLVADRPSARTPRSGAAADALAGDLGGGSPRSTGWRRATPSCGPAPRWRWRSRRAVPGQVHADQHSARLQPSRPATPPRSPSPAARTARCTG